MDVFCSHRFVIENGKEGEQEEKVACGSQVTMKDIFPHRRRDIQAFRSRIRRNRASCMAQGGVQNKSEMAKRSEQSALT
jgi:hypothetical protein